MAFERERRVDLAHVLPAGAAEEIDCPPVGDDRQPRGERPAGVVCLPRAMNGQQHVLHHVIDAVGHNPTPSRDALDDWYAVAQQRLVGDAIACLSGGHQSRPAPVRAGIFCLNIVHAALGSPVPHRGRHDNTDDGGAAGKRAL
jgi:hypothetical protein